MIDFQTAVAAEAASSLTIAVCNFDALLLQTICDDDDDDNDDDDDDENDNNDDVSVFARMTVHAYSAHCALEASPLSPADHHHTSATASYISKTYSKIMLIDNHHT